MLTTSFPLYQGHPAGVFVYEQARHLCRTGISVDILAPLHPGGRRSEVMAGISVRRFSYFWPKTRSRLCYGDGIPENMKKQPLLRFQLPFLVLMFFVNTIRLARRYDVIYAHWSLSGLAGVLAGKIMNRPVVVMIHHGQNRYGNNFLEKFVINNADRVVCNSSFTMEHIVRFFKPRDCSVISPGVDIDVFKPQKISASDVLFEKTGIPGDLPVILAMGRHIEWKGFVYLIEAAAEMKGQVPFVLVLGGQGPETEILRKKAQALGLGKQIIFTGQIPNRDLPRLYNRASVFAQPSIVDKEGNTEGLGVVLMEAMACGTPCVACDVGGIPDIVRDGENGFLVPARDVPGLVTAISKLLNNQALNEKMGKDGRRFIEENYSWARLTRKTVPLLEALEKKSN